MNKIKVKLNRNILIIFIILIVCGCGKSSSELVRENDSLKQYCQKIEEDVNFYFVTMGEVHINLDKIKSIEDEIIVNSLKDGGFLREDVKALLAEIEKLIKESKEKIEALNVRLLTNNTIKIAELNAAAQTLTQEIEYKNEHIADITSELAKRTELISQQSLAIQGLKRDKEERDNIISKNEEQINSVYYIFADAKTLKDKAITAKSGLFNTKKVLQGDFDEKTFTKVDLRKTKTLQIKSKTAKILTAHPTGSYSLVKNENSYTLNISNPNDFWSVSHYLVVQTK
ncbi:MAG: hypothetical protein LBS50_08345 [Prevotellaceae bacterium]|jgi:hypothetical protein|nr:hypothetical protein [Prevotellaceae bacterium]